MDVLLPDWPVDQRIVGAFCTTRHGGLSTGPYADREGAGGLNLAQHVGDDPEIVAQNRKRLQTLLLPAQPLWLDQVHGVEVATHAGALDQPNSADGVVTSKTGAVCAIMTADCLPVILCDAKKRVVGALHAGWRGLAAGIVSNTVRSMRLSGAQDIQAWLGPCIGPACFEVGPEVKAAFIDLSCHMTLPNAQRQTEIAFQPQPKSTGVQKYLADLYALARIALANESVTSVYGGAWCTVTDQRFYSYRRATPTGRMATLIWLK